jgi:hypothetical protein
LSANVIENTFTYHRIWKEGGICKSDGIARILITDLSTKATLWVGRAVHPNENEADSILTGRIHCRRIDITHIIPPTARSANLWKTMRTDSECKTGVSNMHFVCLHLETKKHFNYLECDFCIARSSDKIL